ncbi:MAG: hypothetical protein RLZZ519_586, partial [Bacteroidota bacterium]|jgi:hypothetical protein
VVRYERAKLSMANVPILDCAKILAIRSEDLRPAGIGVLKFVAYRNDSERIQLLEQANSEIQCVVGSKWIPFGQAQHPHLHDFADGVDTLQLLTSLS